MTSAHARFCSLVRCLLAAAIAALLGLGGPVHAESRTLAQVRSNGALRCGIGENLPGFAEKDTGGRYRGFSVDFCRAVAAVVLGDPDKVTFFPVAAPRRFPLLLSGRIDLLAHTATWTITREAGIGVRFPVIYFYDGQGFLVPRASSAEHLADLRGATICVESGTTHVPNLEDTFRARGLAYTPLVVETLPGTADAFFAGKCQAYTSDRSTLSAVRSRAQGGAEQYRILPDIISKEPLCPAVRRGDEAWESIVRWTFNALIVAEERGLTRTNIRSTLEKSSDPDVQRLVREGRIASRSLGLDSDWYIRAVEAGGNYGEIFERNVGAGSPLRIERGLNRLWKDGGLMYSPPFR